jgi:predicted lipoprotein with Yx(FWY)xxD motif
LIMRFPGTAPWGQIRKGKQVRSLKQYLFAAVAALGLVLLAACGTTSKATTAPGAGGATGALVHTAQVSVKGTTETVLTDSKGRTLYYLTSDTATSQACIGQCLGFWPPLLAMGTPTSATALPYQLSVFAGASGQQSEYNGHLLYTFVMDKAAGQANGEGVQGFGGTWHVATLMTQAASASALIHSAQVSVNSTSKTVLTDSKGLTLYYLTSDTPMYQACIGQCLGFWPPLLAMGTPTTATALPHQLTLFSSSSGQQVEYDGHLLYTFVMDKAAGQANGEGVQGFGGTWHVATPNL